MKIKETKNRINNAVNICTWVDAHLGPNVKNKKLFTSTADSRCTEASCRQQITARPFFDSKDRTENVVAIPKSKTQSYLSFKVRIKKNISCLDITMNDSRVTCSHKLVSSEKDYLWLLHQKKWYLFYSSNQNWIVLQSAKIGWHLYQIGSSGRKYTKTIWFHIWMAYKIIWGKYSYPDAYSCDNFHN